MSQILCAITVVKILADLPPRWNLIGIIGPNGAGKFYLFRIDNAGGKTGIQVKIEIGST